MTAARRRWRTAAAHLAVFALIAGAGVGTLAAFTTLERHAALAAGDSAPPPVACLDAAAPGGDACAAALTHPLGALLGLPVAAWALAAHALIASLAWALVCGLVTGRRPVVGVATAATLGLSVILLGGTAAYLIVGLGVLGVACPMCLALHGLAAAVGAAAITGAVLWRADVLAALRRPATWAALGATAAAWVAVAWASSLATAASPPTPTTARAGAPVALAAAAFDDAFARACVADACPDAVLAPPALRPTEHASLVLAEAAGRPALVALIDLGCAACRADHVAMAPLYRDLVHTGRAGLQLVVWPHDGACNPHVAGAGKDPTGSCAAGAALVCAARHGGAGAALSYIDWELASAAGYLTPADRARWLALNVGRLGSRCLEAEAAMGTRGTLGAHADHARRLRDRLARGGGVGAAACAAGGAAVGAWWCFDATPSFVVFRDGAAPKADRAADPRGVTGGPRRDLLDRCLEP